MMPSLQPWVHTAVRIFRERKERLLAVAANKAWRRPSYKSVNWRWAVRRVPTMLGWPGAVAAGLLTMCAAFYVSTIAPAQEKLASVHQHVAVVQDRSRQAGHGSEAVQPVEEQLARFYRMFPQEQDLPRRMETIFASAQNHGIALEQGEYKVSRGNEGGLVRFQMTFPVKGDYRQIRKYLSSLMADVPTLSLQQVQFKRQKVGDAEVEANIKLVLYLLEQKS